MPSAAGCGARAPPHVSGGLGLRPAAPTTPSEDEGTVAHLIREEPSWLGVTPSGRCRSALRAAQLRLVVGFLHSDRLTASCPLVLEAGRLTETIAACLVYTPLSAEEQRALDAQLFCAAASAAGEAAKVELLAGEGANVEARKFGQPLVVGAARKGHTQVVEALLRLGCDPNARDPAYGSTALVEAARGHGGVVSALLKHGGAELDAVDNDGRTALMHAVANGRAAIAAQLVEAGADATLRATGGWARGKTALEIAKAGGHAEIAALLPRWAGSGRSRGPKVWNCWSPAARRDRRPPRDHGAAA